MEVVGLKSKGLPNLVNGAYVGDEPNEMRQFQQEYIPHVTVVDAHGTIKGHRCRPPKAAIALAKALVGTEKPEEKEE